MIYPKGNPYVVATPSLNNLLFTDPNNSLLVRSATQQYLQQQGSVSSSGSNGGNGGNQGGGGSGNGNGQMQGSSGGGGSGSGSSSPNPQLLAYQQQQQTLTTLQQIQQMQQQQLPNQQMQPQLPYHYPLQYYPDTKIENPEFIVSTTILAHQTPPPLLSIAAHHHGANNGTSCRSCGAKNDNQGNTSSSSSGSAGGSISSSRAGNNGGASGSSGSSMQGFGSVSTSSSGSSSSSITTSTSSGSNTNSGNGSCCSASANRAGKSDNSSNGGGGLQLKTEDGPGRTNCSSIKRSMSSSSEVRMAPRPAKNPAWSFPSMMSIPSPITDDPSSCSDNASDHSDKIESMSNSHGHSHGGNNSGSNNNGGNGGGSQQQHQNQHGKPRKRKMGSFSSASGHGHGGDHLNHSGNANSSNNSAQASLWADAESLAADFDGSLSGLGADLSSSSYDMSEALLGLPTIYHHNRGLSHNSGNGGGSSGGGGSGNGSGQNNGGGGGSSSQNQHSGSVASLRDSSANGDLTPLSASQHHGGSSVSLPGDFHFENRSSPSFATAANGANSGGLDCERRFQYVLAAATSIATKMNEETITYLNQGQPYEIKLKKLGELTAYRGTVFRTVVRLCFHDRRLQFSEREQIALWEYSHPRDRILQVDLPLSYGVTMMNPTADMSTNAISFLWEPLKEVGLYVKVNCISTEFTPKKHGGEKGVPFRLMIETYSHPDGVRLHAAASQVKVFKLKGADRKHKQDREKILKKTASEQAKLQPSYECTVLSDISLESLDSPTPSSLQAQVAGSQSGGVVLSPPYSLEYPLEAGADGDSPDAGAGGVGALSGAGAGVGSGGGLGGGNGGAGCESGCNGLAVGGSSSFSAHFSSESVRRWLVRNRFTATKTLWDFNGLDLLRLNKEELIEMCGLAEGIRLFNALHYKITFYVTLGNQGSDMDESNSSESGGSSGSSAEDNTFHPVCLSSPSVNELMSVLNSLFKNNNGSSGNGSGGGGSGGGAYQQTQGYVPVERLFLSVNANGNSRIRVVLNEQLLSTQKDQTAFRVYKSGCDVSMQVIE